MTRTTSLVAAPSRPATSWSGVFALTLCVFALVASEFLPVSLLTPIAAELKVSEGLAGSGITISGVFAVLTSLLISTLARDIDRKTLLLTLTGLMGLSGAVVGLAPNYTMYMVGRGLIGVVIGGFWSMSAAVAMRLVPAADVPKALAIFNGGNALATVVAAPLGSYLGNVMGWRGAFLCLVLIALLTFAWQWTGLPAMKPELRDAESASVLNVFRLLKSRPIAFGTIAAGAFFMGQFELYTYVRPFLETVTRVGAPTLSVILFVIGVAGFLGTVGIGPLLRRGLFRTLVGIPLIMAAIAVALLSFGGSMVATSLLLALWGLVATAAPVGWWSWLARALPRDAEAGGGLMVATVQLCIASGSAFGGVLLDESGYRSMFLASAAMLVSAALMAFLAYRSEQRSRQFAVASISADM